MHVHFVQYMQADKQCSDLQRQVDLLMEQSDADHAALQTQVYTLL